MAGKITGYKPVASQVLIEILTAQEMAGSKIIVDNDVKMGAPQAYVRGLGPSIKPEEWGFDVGNRVVLTGKYTPLPRLDTHDGHEWGVIEPANIKAVLTE
jgi:co-chaperonin GroES (HSP10)